MSRSDRRLLAVAAALATAALAVGIGRTDLWPPDETRVAEISREMRAERTWLLPRLNGTPFLEEPPLFYWLQAGAYRLAGGPSAAAARWPATVAAVLGVLVTMALARAVGASAGIAALILATAPEYWWMARSGTPDTAAASATALALTLFFLAWRSGRRSLLVAAAVTAGTAFWLKSLLGVGLASITIAAFLAWVGRGRLRTRDVVWAAVATGSGAALWLVLLWRAEGGGAVAFFVLKNHLGRLVGAPEEGHLRSALYYVPNLALDLFSWSIALPAAVASAWQERGDPARFFVLLWAGLMTLALTASASKSAHYLLPAYPALAVLVAGWWVRAGERLLDRTTWSLLAVVLLLACPGLGLVLLSLEPNVVMRMVETGSHHPMALAGELVQVPTGAASWEAALLLALLGWGFFAARRARKPAQAAVAAAACATALHIIIVIGVLPQFNLFSSTRPWGEGLGRAARNGVRLVAFGFPKPETLSPFMFYAGQRILAVNPGREVEALLAKGAVCVLVRRDAYARLGPSVRELPSTFGMAGGLRFVLVSARSGECPQVEPPAGVTRRHGSQGGTPSA
ncbi:MAG: hypothetical protein E6J59_10525 [Deltaproteobacteria bacterium]|nr:MAG: hypothetical protein E6J59_10525 [Deltaproteobacteria bacterium]